MEVLVKINQYRNSKKYCDVTLVVDNINFEAHKAVLAASSEYFSRELTDETSCLNLDFITSSGFEDVLKFIYTGELDINHKNIEYIYEVAMKLDISKLQDLCKEYSEKIETLNAEVVETGDDSSEKVDLIAVASEVSIDSTELTEIKRSKPISIFPNAKKHDRKAKQDAYKTINQAFEIINDFEDGFDDMNDQAHITSDEDYKEVASPSPPATNSISTRTSKRRRSSRSKTFLCPTCNKCFNQALLFQIHLLCHDEPDSRLLDDDLVDSAKLKEHMEQIEIGKCGLKPVTTVKKPHLTCDICYKMFTNAHNLSVHLTTHKKPVNPKQVTKRVKRQHFCTLCDKVFGSNSHLQRHVLSHTGERKHCCTTCGKLFLKNDHLKRHERTHTTERPFACEECGKTFRDKDHLKRHHLTHSDLRPFSCDICGKQFKERNTLHSHLKVHTSSTFLCDQCDKAFKTEEALKRHVARHQRHKPHVCEVCGKNFPFSGRLRKHMLTHTGARPYECDTCDKQFRDAHSLKLHKKKHTGIGLHPCGECGKEFTNIFHLKRHERVHTGEKPFRCDICKRTFARVDNLEAHKRACLVKQQNNDFGGVDMLMWNRNGPTIHPVQNETEPAQNENLPLPISSPTVQSNVADTPTTLTNHQPTLPTKLLPNFTVTIPSMSLTNNSCSMVNAEYPRPRCYGLPSHLYSLQTSESQQQCSQIQMPTPLQPTHTSMMQNPPPQELVGLDVNAAISSYIGYGASL